MLYTETIEYLYSRLPVFQKQGATALKEGLGGIIKFCNHLGNPQNSFKSIHIGGTNGKGSTSHMLASIMQEAGFKTGLYTSPHLVDFNERIRIDGQVIAPQYVVDFVEKNKVFIESNSFSFFEVSVALAFQYFADSKIDIAVVEVGLGGRLDSTNIIHPVLSIITNISNDHAQILGDTLAKIASEKAGIIKKNTPVVISLTQPEITSVFKEKAQLELSEIFFADQEYEIESTDLKENLQVVNIKNTKVINDYIILELDLMGTYQKQNILGVLKAVNVLNNLGITVSDESLKKGVSKVVQNTGLMGRWQKISKNPLVICDTGHNEAGIKEVLNNIYLQKFANLHIVIGFVKDKDIDKILKLLPEKANYYFCQAAIPRALESHLLLEKAKNNNLNGVNFETVQEAYLAAIQAAISDDFIFVGGSTFIVADLLTYLKNK
jgi:dihydrofolate synthase / folylpolyglutamate synthase